MIKRYTYLFIFLIVLFLSVGGIYLMSGDTEEFSEEDQAATDIESVLGTNEDSKHFKQAVEIPNLQFPKDHGPHPEFKNEWWYFTGNLQTENGRHFGYQFTLFRSGFYRPVEEEEQQLFMGHFAITDTGDNKFYSFEKFSRSDLELSGASAKPVKVWVENWYLKQNPNNPKSWQLYAQAEGVELVLNLRTVKKMVLQGEKGLSQKGAQKGNASIYYSFTRLATAGKLSINNKQFDLKGASWFDREWGTSFLEKGVVGWDWFALQMDDKTELMVYRLRKQNGSYSPFSHGVLVKRNGSTQKLPGKAVNIQVKRSWKSPLSGIQYPVQWEMNIPSMDLKLDIISMINNQEHDFQFRYWEGAVGFNGSKKGKPIAGKGYVELTGYH